MICRVQRLRFRDIASLMLNQYGKETGHEMETEIMYRLQFMGLTPI